MFAWNFMLTIGMVAGIKIVRLVASPNFLSVDAENY